MRRREIQLPDSPVDFIVVDGMKLNQIKDIAHETWMETQYPNANLIMIEALKRWLESKGVTVPYSVQFGRK